MKYKKLSPLNKLRAQLLLSLWYDTRTLVDLPDTILAEARKYMFFNKRFKTRFDRLNEQKGKSVEIIQEDASGGGIICPVKRPKYLDVLSVYFKSMPMALQIRCINIPLIFWANGPNLCLKSTMPSKKKRLPN